ncbi:MULTISPECIES: AtpZ/AtpI family protein [Alkalihalophilus]|jgi:F0F1-type ATP synthase assembly protein I|uniref:AtpZ/AtpI family protein n=2 Tax=Alkalihalophilus TaxID=2893060 RepID=A0AAJ2NQ01_ALKPS|nr:MULTISPECIES: AtpZ/AtpI family protein [Alkalihalophilus]ERN51923.1 AtpZ protein [Alkalihalophilus marmarensis DSM 21297]MCM3489756.1 AtpZ/AtpI family protein [Alkalihalophilus marmarensis]MDV2886474.1 AtpZ/AtpI family protein [Alkalihalophilus pseudofirmus]MEC2073487.1 AtpZ/AtpI family protein [Alkalihalophilus marmarensis]OLS38819.1 AtpZ protein [Alkalihalophilus pseudofirmus]
MSNGKRNPWRAMALVSVISSYVVGGVVAGVFTGLWLGNRLGAKPVFLIVSILIGLGVGFYGVMKTIEPFLGDDE